MSAVNMKTPLPVRVGRQRFYGGSDHAKPESDRLHVQPILFRNALPIFRFTVKKTDAQHNSVFFLQYFNRIFSALPMLLAFAQEGQAGIFAGKI